MASLATVYQDGAICPREVFRITPCNIREPENVSSILVRSHDDIHVTEDTLTESFISNSSITSQQVNFETASSSISTFNFSILENNDEFSLWMADQIGCTLRGATIETFIGDESLPFSKYVLTTTQQIRSVQHHNCEWRFAASGIVRSVVSDVFSESTAPLFGNVFDATAENLPAELCDSVTWLTQDAAGNPVGRLKLQTEEKFYRDSRTGDYFLKVQHDGGCEVMRANRVEEDVQGRLQEGDTVEGVICILNNGTVPVFNISVSNSIYDIYDNPLGAALLPGDSGCIWRWRATNITRAEAEAELANFGTTLVTFTTTLDGTPTPDQRSTATPEFDNQLGPLPSVVSTQEGVHVEVRQLWFLPDGQIECGGSERDRGFVPLRSYNIVERGMFNTPVCQPDDKGIIIGDGDDVSAAIIIEGSAPEVLYQVMTGRYYDTDELAWEHEDHDRQPDYSARIDPRWINRDSFSAANVPEAWALQMRFICPPPDDIVDFWELEILRWAGYFLREDPDGRLSLVPLNQAGDENYVVGTIDNEQIFSTTQMTEDWDVPTQLTLAWDFDPCEQIYRATTVLANENAVADNCGIRASEYCAFQGVRSDITSGPNIRNHMRQWLAFRSVPRGKGCIDICLGDALSYRVGDTVILKSIDHTDRFNRQKQIGFYKGYTLSRAVGISSIRFEPRQGFARLCYEMPLKPPYEASDIEFNTQPCATPEDYCQNRIPLSDVLNIVDGVVQESGATNLPIDQYCHEGDLTLTGEFLAVNIGVGRTLGLAVSGKLTLADDLVIRGNGQGFDGYTENSVLSPTNEPGLGTNVPGRGATHGYTVFADLIEDDGAIFVDNDNFGTDPLQNEADPDVSLRQKISTIAIGQDPIEPFNPTPHQINLPVGDVFYDGCESIDAPRPIRGRTFAYEDPLSPLQMTRWELAGNGGGYAGTQRFSGLGTVSTLKGGNGGAGGMGLAIVAHDVIVQTGVVIDLSGAKGQPPPDEPLNLAGRTFVGLRGVGGNAGRAIIVLDGSNTSFLPQPTEFISQRTGGRGDAIHPDIIGQYTGRILNYCGVMPDASRLETNATLYRNLSC